MGSNDKAAAGAGAEAEAKGLNPVTSMTTANVGMEPATNAPKAPDDLYQQGSADPQGTDQGEVKRDLSGTDNDPTSGIGTDGEMVVWEARYSMLNFLGRGLISLVLLGGWLVLADYTWREGHRHLGIMTTIVGGFVAIFLLILAWRMLQARYSHYYRLTTRRLFVSSGMLSRRRDMMELLKLKDVYTRQESLLQRMLGLGTVIAESTEHGTPTFYLPGVIQPKQVMDLIWHHARAERDQRSMKVESI